MGQVWQEQVVFPIIPFPVNLISSSPAWATIKPGTVLQIPKNNPVEFIDTRCIAVQRVVMSDPGNVISLAVANNPQAAC